MEHAGGCRCGAVRYRVEGPPDVVGLCHCADCRKETGSAFLAYAKWPIARFTASGSYTTWAGRSFCPTCGSRLFHLDDRHAEIVLGSLDAAPTPFVPQREGWTKRREPWLAPVSHAHQHHEDTPRG